ncbi:hypothetical protein EP073_04235 [Geovibrio thiophilus]|uniref:HAMP domain-containing protein n=1 Tax=Geovibrio thiophilus TaxID=139438 RepID=A0A3R5X264_9BACT|nr:sensor histidine kinase [Geovibrio thiophilus]QAR32644.1 hypothetical protein EP073_04235 [Geovibrio thiophilus]
MKKWIEYCLTFTKRLWFQLAVSYSLLAICAMSLVIVMQYGMSDYRDFRAAITPENIERLAADEKLIISQGIRDTDNTEWLDKARDNIRKKLINITEDNDDGIAIYRITNSSLPEVYIQITDKNDRLLMSDPVDLPEKAAHEFLLQQQQQLPAAQSSSKRLTENGSIWVDMPVTDSSGTVIGRLRILYIAEFNLWVQIKSIFHFLMFITDNLLLLSIPIGIACGLIASRYVTKQLQKMNEVTESWRQGNFEPRIELPDDDVLIRHSRQLNDMAQDLEMYLSLKQNLAVSDERSRVARELHDTVKQKLFALGLQLATAKSKPAVMEAAQEHILEAETITREAQHDLMEIITQLRPAGTDDTSLFERIGMIADDFRRRFGVNIELSCFDSVRFNAHTEHHVLRIVQEALMNAIRHGSASQIIIESRIDHAASVLTITDNGSGFDTGKKTGGFGITSMRDRARHLPCGEFEIESAENSGTLIKISWRNET